VDTEDNNYFTQIGCKAITFEEPIMNQSNSFGAQLQNLQNYGPTLADAFGFTAEDIAANRAGMVTDSQRGQLKADGKKYMKIMMLLVGGIFIYVIVATLFLPRGEPIRQAISTQPVVTAVVMAIGVLFYLLLLARTFLSTRRSGTGNIKVISISGPFKLIGRPVSSLDGLVYQRVKIGRRDSFITAAQASTLVPGTTYRAYLNGKGQMAKILSIEAA
jgi:hypothetical protein